MKTTMGNKYETGATSHAVNDLILFTDNTRELAELRDSIYLSNIKKATIDSSIFNPLLRTAIHKYIQEFPDTDSHAHIKNMTASEKAEYKLLYAEDSVTWEKEHGYRN